MGFSFSLIHCVLFDFFLFRFDALPPMWLLLLLFLLTIRLVWIRLWLLCVSHGNGHTWTFTLCSGDCATLPAIVLTIQLQITRIYMWISWKFANRAAAYDPGNETIFIFKLIEISAMDDHILRICEFLLAVFLMLLIFHSWIFRIVDFLWYHLCYKDPLANI